MKVYLDNNFFTSYETCKDNEYKKQIKNAFIDNKFSIYPSLELVEEMLGIAKDGVSEELKDRLNLFLEIFPRRVLNYYGRIIRNELGIEIHNVFLPASEVKSIKTTIPCLINGQFNQEDILECLNSIKLKKKGYEDYYK
ncbi:MAG: hypothetical protein WC937_00005 [Candidatus Omnitrophota bacterium]|jgi:hypothetical protein